MLCYYTRWIYFCLNEGRGVRSLAVLIQKENNCEVGRTRYTPIDNMNSTRPDDPVVNAETESDLCVIFVFNQHSIIINLPASMLMLSIQSRTSATDWQVGTYTHITHSDCALWCFVFLIQLRNKNQTRVLYRALKQALSTSKWKFGLSAETLSDINACSSLLENISI